MWYEFKDRWLWRDGDVRERRDYSADAQNSSSLLDADTVRACVFELAGGEDDEADADTGENAGIKADSGTSPASTITSDDSGGSVWLRKQRARLTCSTVSGIHFG